MKKIKLPLITFLFFFLISMPSYSQNVCDSLEKVMNEALMAGEFKKVFEMGDTLKKICCEEKGENSLSYINALTACSVAFLNLGETDEALKIILEAENIFLKNYGADHPDYGNILSTIYGVFLLKGDFNKALEYIDKSLLNCEKTVGKNDFKYGSRLGMKVTLLMELGKNQEALQYAQQALEITNNTIGQDNFYSIAFAQNLGFIQTYNGLHNEAIETLNSALQNAKTVLGENHFVYGSILTTLGQAHSIIGNELIAKKYLSDAIQIFKMNEPLDYLQLKSKGIAYNNLANVFLTMGQYDQALIYYDSTILIFEKLYGKISPDLVIFNGNIGQIYYAKGEVFKALPYLHRALDMIKSNPQWNRTNFSSIFNLLGYAYSDLGEDEKALEFIEKGKAMLSEYDKGKTDHILLLNQADLLNKMKRNEEAEKINLLALQNILETFGERHAFYAGTMSTMSDFYCNVKKYRKAIQYADKAIGIYEKTIGKDHPEYIKALMNKGLVLLEKKDYKYAKKMLLTALNNWSKSSGDYHPNLIEIYKGLSKIENAEGNYLSALKYYIDARKIIFYQINNNFAVLSENGKSGYLEQHKPFFSDFHTFLISNISKFPQADTLIYNDILSMKGSVLSSSKSVYESIKSSGDSVLLSYYFDWKSLRQLIAKQESLDKSTRQFDNNSLDSLIQLSDIMEQKLTMNSSEFRQALTPLSWRDIKKGLLPEEAVVEFFTVDDEDKKNNPKYYAIVIRGDYEFPEIVSLFTENQLLSILNYDNSNIEDYLYWVYETGNKKNITALYQMVWQPVEAHLNKIKKVYYSPSGLLHRIAFAAIEKKKGISLIDEYELNYINSGKDIVYREQSSSSGIKTALMVGGINYETDSMQMAQNMANNPEYYSYSTSTDFESGNFADTVEKDSLVAEIDHSLTEARGNIAYLHGSLKEIQNIGDLLKKNSVHTIKWSGYQALEDNFKKCGQFYPSPDIIHLSTHGYFLQSKSINPLFDSYLAFAGVQNVYKGGNAIPNFEDGFLNAYEVVDMNLANTRLIVLSACDTGLGDIKIGEGVYGLPRAFKLAGCDHVIMSLWKIPDQKTADFMLSFYQNWLSGLNINDAFLKTQREMKEKYKDPYYWAAFVLI